MFCGLMENFVWSEELEQPSVNRDLEQEARRLIAKA